MSAAENEAPYRRFIAEIANRCQVSAIEEFAATDHVGPEALPGVPTDREAARQCFAELRSALAPTAKANEATEFEWGRVAGEAYRR